MKILILFFWVVTRCSDVLGYQRFRWWRQPWYISTSQHGVTTQKTTT